MLDDAILRTSSVGVNIGGVPPMTRSSEPHNYCDLQGKVQAAHGTEVAHLPGRSL